MDLKRQWPLNGVVVKEGFYCISSDKVMNIDDYQ